MCLDTVFFQLNVFKFRTLFESGKHPVICALSSFWINATISLFSNVMLILCNIQFLSIIPQLGMISMNSHLNSYPININYTALFPVSFKNDEGMLIF